MKRLLHHVKMMIVFSVVWVILEERLSITTVVVGALVGLATMLATDRYVLVGDYEQTYRLGFFVIVRYVVSLIVQIYVAGIHAIVRVFTGNLHVGIVEITTTLTSEFHIALLANSITLTPGTVTLERTGNSLKVIWIDCTTTDPEEAGKQIKLNFERLLSGGRE
jgi:multicomponent Na+:H+ antiporter subunit E